MPSAAEVQVLVFAGGIGKRMGSREPKPLMNLGGEALVDRCVRFFKAEGFRDFVFLLGYAHERVARHIGDGSRLGINASFSVDPKAACGRGVSLLHALEVGAVDPGRRSMVTFPDDVFTDPRMPTKVLSAHLSAVKSFGVAASLVLTKGRKWPYGVAELDTSNLVRRFVEKPFIERPTSVGNYVLEKEVYPMIADLVKPGPAPVELEQTLIPELASKGKLFGVFIPSDSWYPINTTKEFEEAERVLLRRR